MPSVFSTLLVNFARHLHRSSNYLCNSAAHQYARSPHKALCLFLWLYVCFVLIEAKSVPLFHLLKRAFLLASCHQAVKRFVLNRAILFRLQLLYSFLDFFPVLFLQSIFSMKYENSAHFPFFLFLFLYFF